MIYPSSSYLRDFLFAVPAAAMAAGTALLSPAIVAVAGQGSLYDVLHILVVLPLGVFGTLLFGLPLCLLGGLPAYLVLRGVNGLRLLPCTLVGIGGGLLLWLTMLPAQGAREALLLALSGGSAGAAAYGALKWRAERRLKRFLDA